MTLDKFFFISMIELRPGGETRRVEEVIGCEISHKAEMRQMGGFTVECQDQLT